MATALHGAAGHPIGGRSHCAVRSAGLQTRRRMSPRWLLLILWTGCTPLSTLQTARVIPQGSSRIGLGGGLGYNLSSASAGATVAMVDLSYRYGIADRMDVGIRVRPISAVADAKFMFWDGG